MKFVDKNSLCQAWQSGERPTFLFFWGHQPSPDGRIRETCFSQWWESAFEVEGVRYATAEHWMMACKARLFGDEAILAEILRVATPQEAKALGRKVSGFVGQEWDVHKMAYVIEGNMHKFGQHEDLRAFLLQTGDKVIVEASPYDRIWGIGLRASQVEAQDPNTWRGENLLGFALMAVRERLRELS